MADESQSIPPRPGPSTANQRVVVNRAVFGGAGSEWLEHSCWPLGWCRRAGLLVGVRVSRPSLRPRRPVVVSVDHLRAGRCHFGHLSAPTSAVSARSIPLPSGGGAAVTGSPESLVEGFRPLPGRPGPPASAASDRRPGECRCRPWCCRGQSTEHGGDVPVVALLQLRPPAQLQRVDRAGDQPGARPATAVTAKAVQVSSTGLLLGAGPPGAGLYR